MEKKTQLIKKCGIYEEDATCICYECINYYCESCFTMIHEKKKYNHKKEKIDPYVPPEIKCPEHKRGIMDLFCVDEKGKTLYIINTLFFDIIISNSKSFLFFYLS